MRVRGSRMPVITIKQLFVICSGFAFTILTVCAIYVGNLGMDARYQTQSANKPTDRALLATSRVHRPRATSHRVEESISKSRRESSQALVADNLSTTRTNTSAHVHVSHVEQFKSSPAMKKQNRSNVTEKRQGTQGVPRIGNSSDSRTLSMPKVPQMLVQDGLQLVKGTPDPVYTHHGYVSVLDPSKKLNLHCTQCAIVSSSGQLLQSGMGYLIDEADCVFRMNDAPVPSYEEDVGSRTTVRVVGHPSTPILHKKRRYLLQESSPRYVVGWGPAKPMRTTGTGYAFNHLKELAKLLKNVDFFYLTQSQMERADEMFEAETGKPRMGSGTFLSTGWFTMILARSACDEIHVYGMVNDGYCQSLTRKNVPYHYYNQYGRKECDYYKAHETGKKGFHRFMTEKSIFARWALEQPPIYFHVPEWNP